MALGHRVLLPFLLATAALLTAGCGSSAASVAPLAQRIGQAPRPDGAVVRSAEQRDGDFERGPSAELVLSVPLALDAACRTVVAGYLQAGYDVAEYGENPVSVDDAEAWCAAQQVAPVTPGDVRAYIVTAYPPGTPHRYPDDGFSAVMTLDDRADPDRPNSTLLRLAVN